MYRFFRPANPQSPTPAKPTEREIRLSLSDLDQRLVFRAGEEVDLRITEEGREIVHQGVLTQTPADFQESSEWLPVVLLDHALLILKSKSSTGQYKVFRRPIPLELLVVSKSGSYPESPDKRRSLRRLPSMKAVPPKQSDHSFPITFAHLGRKSYEITLWTSTEDSQQQWVGRIQKQQEAMRERNYVFETVSLSEHFFLGVKQVSCAAPYDKGRRIVYGTADGVYLSDVDESYREPSKALALRDVAQVDVLEELLLLIVLSEGQVLTFPLDALDTRNPTAGLERAKRITSHASFFKVTTRPSGTMVCIVRTNPLSSTIKVLQPSPNSQTSAVPRSMVQRLMQGRQDGDDSMKLVREFYIAGQTSSVHFLKNRLCLSCSDDFEIVDLDTLETQSLMDPSDKSLAFVQNHEGLKPMAIYRVDDDFLVCYDELAFYVDKSGCWARKHFMVFWEGCPLGFALRYPYILAFDSTFIEIRHAETGQMVQVIQGTNLRCLFSYTPPLKTSDANSPTGRDDVLAASDDRVVKLQMRSRESC